MTKKITFTPPIFKFGKWCYQNIFSVCCTLYKKKTGQVICLDFFKSMKHFFKLENFASNVPAAPHLRFKEAQPKMCPAPKVENGVDN